MSERPSLQYLAGGQIVDAGGAVVATVLDPTYGPVFAAAPDLQAALVATVPHVGRLWEMTPAGRRREEIQLNLDAAEAALAKARTTP